MLDRLNPELELVAHVALVVDKVSSVGATPDGVRMQFMLHGTMNGAKLKGEFPPSTVAYLRIDADGVGTIDVRAPLKLPDGAAIELTARGRYDFGHDGYQRALAGDLPDSDLGWCPRLVTGDARYLWVNRVQLLGVGRLLPRELRVDYDLFALRAGQAVTPHAPDAARTPKPAASGGY